MVIQNEMKLFNEKYGLIALKRAFPTVNAYYKFQEKDKTVSSHAIPRFIEYAEKINLIPEASEKEFIQFLETESQEIGQPSTQLTFTKVIQEITGGTSVNTLVKQLNLLAKEFHMPEIHAPMFTRLKKDFKPDTAKKRALLRILAFWIGLYKPEYQWDFITLSELVPNHSMEIISKEKEGVKMDFSFKQRGGIIDFQMIEWLKDEVAQVLKDLKLFHLVGIPISLESTTVVSLSIPKRKGPSGEPRLFDRAIRDSLAIAHQIVVRWTLSDKSSNHNKIIVAIDAGDFSKLEISLQPLLDIDIPGDPSILLTDFSKTCAGIADLKVIFDKKSIQHKITSSNVLTIWVVKHFWFLYYDFIPCLLEEDMLPKKLEYFQMFEESLKYPSDGGSEQVVHKALKKMRQFPLDDMLAMEIAKVLMARRLFYEAIAVLDPVIASDPYHLVARIFRLLMFINLALQQQDFDLFKLLFNRARDEGLLIQKNHNLDEDFFCEFGFLYYSRALYILDTLRKNKPINVKDKTSFSLDEVMKYLEKSKICLQKGLVLSPTGSRSTLLLVHITSLMQLLRNNDPDYVTSCAPIVDNEDIYLHTSIRYFISLGLIKPDFLATQNPDLMKTQLETLARKTQHAINVYKQASHLRIFQPNVSYFIATVIWDCSVILTIGAAKLTIEWLETAIIQAQQLFGDNVGVYSIASSISQIQSPEHFIACVNKAIDKINKIIKDDRDKDDDHVIDKNKVGGFKLLTMHIDEEVESEPLLA